MSHKKGNAKHKKRCETYKKLGTKIVNKIKKLTKHLKTQPHDTQAKKALNGI